MKDDKTEKEKRCRKKSLARKKEKRCAQGAKGFAKDFFQTSRNHSVRSFVETN